MSLISSKISSCPSAGKDSTVLAHLALVEPIGAAPRSDSYLDEEVVYDSTVKQVGTS